LISPVSFRIYTDEKIIVCFDEFVCSPGIYTFHPNSLKMTDQDQKPAIFHEALADYRQIRDKAGVFLTENFTDLPAIRASERQMTGALRSEYRRLLLLKVFKTDIEQETFKLIRFFFLRERRENVGFHDYSKYLRRFMNRNRQKMKKPWNPKPDITFDEVIAEMTSRIAPPWDDPCPVLNEWIPMKIRESAKVIPADILKRGGIGKIFRVISGVFLYALTDLESDTPLEEAKQRIDRALKSGFYFGLLYPLADDILDSGHHLSSVDKNEVLRLMNHWIGGDFETPNGLDIKPSVSALKKALRELYELYGPEERKELIRLSYLLHFAQMEDQQKEDGKEYSLRDIYAPALLKAAFTRMISCWFSGTRLTVEMNNDIMETGLVFQMMDDFPDMADDRNEGCFTSFTHYYSCDGHKPLNPWLVYLRALDLFIRKSPNITVCSRALLRRVSLSIRYFMPDDRSPDSIDYLGVILSESPESERIVKKIIEIKMKAVDPEMALFEPVDVFFKSWNGHTPFIAGMQGLSKAETAE